MKSSTDKLGGYLLRPSLPDAADIVAITTESGEVIHAAAVRILNERGEFSATQGSLPPWIRPYTKVS